DLVKRRLFVPGVLEALRRILYLKSAFFRVGHFPAAVRGCRQPRPLVAPTEPAAATLLGRVCGPGTDPCFLLEPIRDGGLQTKAPSHVARLLFVGQQSLAATVESEGALVWVGPHDGGRLGGADGS